MDRDEAGPAASSEPTVLDWFKSLLKLRPISVPDRPSEGTAQAPLAPTAPLAPRAVPAELKLSIPISWVQVRVPAAFALAFLAQALLEKRTAETWAGVGLYLAAAALIAWATWMGDLRTESPPASDKAVNALSVRRPYLALGLVLSLLAFLTAWGNQLRPIMLVFWAGSLAAVLFAFWEGDLPLRQLIRRTVHWLASPKIHLSLDTWSLVALLAFAVTAYFRLGHLESIPGEMTSDHAEKWLDVLDILDGRMSIFFPRNAGREPMQMYMVVAAVKWFGADISYLTLKLCTALVGVLTLPFIYLLGLELGGRRTGLVAMILAGIGYWPNVISRFGLRLPFAPLFVAPVLWLLARGLRLRRRNELLLSGLLLGLGMYGYSAFRVVPLAVVLAGVIYLAHRQASGHRWVVLGSLVAAALVAAVGFAPLLRVAVDIPEAFFFRTMTRVSGMERPLPGPVIQVFLSNLWNALRMFGWDDGETWIISIPHRPALDWVTGGLFHLAVVMLVVRYIRERNWLDLFLPLSIPVLLLPSVLSLAFPAENPGPNRAADAIVPVFTMAALPLAAIPNWARSAARATGQNTLQGYLSRIVGPAVVVALLVMSADMNFRLVFKDYATLHRQSTWNNSEAGQVMRGFADSGGTYETAHVVGFPHWLDTRIVAITANRPGTDQAIWPDQLPQLVGEPRAQLFLVDTRDAEGLTQLRTLFPDGTLSLWRSKVEGKDFYIYFVPSKVSLPTPEAAPQP